MISSLQFVQTAHCTVHNCSVTRASQTFFNLHLWLDCCTKTNICSRNLQQRKMIKIEMWWFYKRALHQEYASFLQVLFIWKVTQERRWHSSFSTVHIFLTLPPEMSETLISRLRLRPKHQSLSLIFWDQKSKVSVSVSKFETPIQRLSLSLKFWN